MATRQDDELGGGGAEPAPFRVLPHTEEVANFLAHQQHQNQNYLIHQQQHGQAPGPMMWPPPPYPPHLQQQQPQPHLYNEYLYNLTYSGQPGQPETYSVLPVGHGNFLKVYHCPENQVSEASAPLFTHINMAPLNHHQLQHHQTAPPTPPQPTPLYELFATNPLTLPQAQQQEAQQRQSQQTQSQSPTAPVIHSPSSANLLINNLVNNWSPNLTGGSYIQFGDEVSENDIHQADPLATQQPQVPKQEPQEPLSKSVSPLPVAPKPVKAHKMPLATATVSPTAINKSCVVVPGHPEGKKRIVAEVKPMPMSYSDVLSKGTKLSAAGAEMRAGNGVDYSTQPQRRQGKEDGNGNREMRTAKRSPMHDAKEIGSAQASVGHAHASRGKKRGPVNQAAPLKVQQSQSLQQPTPQTQIKSSKAINQEKKRPLQPKNFNSNILKSSEQKINSASVPSNSSLQSHSNSTPATNFSSLSRKSGSNRTNSYASHSNHTGANCNLGSSSNNNTFNYSSNNNVSSSSSKRYSSSNLNSNSTSGYSYSSKRNRSNAYSSSNSPTHANGFSSNRNYELAKRILHTWWIYTLKLLTWLFYLVYDIVVLGFSMGFERMTLAYVSGLAYARQLHKELKQNSGKPSIWWRSYWRRFDTRFAKNSRWAVWRRFYKRKPPEPTSEQFKTGRLPQTGEEAMYSLLNCKGKDAYSILGVPPDSSQEQIRKHYKKIAVLVHPDKNKQAGAEEAFKVLQRAFELIGEPENRLIYDQSIAETLHAEKAWTELHDLLSQLQTKMAEAANTIRCSTCSQRHPRKLTERPHYAARECASCKIRHSAKDGDIWAETSMMGLRWKYLALMDGKVYDITEWANCQKGALSHLEPNSHMVQYRIVRGAQQQQQQQQQQQHQQPQQPHHDRGVHHPGGGVSGVSEATLHEFLDNLYSGQHPGAPNAFAGNARRRTRRN
ncbi:hypothetical protein KR084_012814 [Drosophila pseudotakahashii]|nr:hypothetical protein KR084_012814 [Drosophila pseudotakahashii]